MSIDPTDIVAAGKQVVLSEAVKGTLSEAWQAILGDRVAAWRLANAAKLQIKVKKEFEKLGLEPNRDRVPERYAVTWFEEATKQDEDEIQDIFARLLALAASGNKSALDRRNLEIVSKMTPNDAALFEEMAGGGWGARHISNTYYWDEGGYFHTSKPTKVDINDFNRSFEHLINLGILSRFTKSEEKINDRSLLTAPYIQTKVKNVVILTETGKVLYDAVRINQSDNDRSIPK